MPNPEFKAHHQIHREIKEIVTRYGLSEYQFDFLGPDLKSHYIANTSPSMRLYHVVVRARRIWHEMGFDPVEGGLMK